MNEDQARDFEERFAPFRDELRAHCHRMLGSLSDADDALQETMIGAWKGLAGFEGRGSFRSWLFASRPTPASRSWPTSPSTWLASTTPPTRSSRARPFHYADADGTASSGAAGSLLPDARIVPRCGRRSSGDPADGLAGAGGLRGARLATDLAVPHRHGVGPFVLTLAGDRIRAMSRFENGVLPSFGLPRSLPAR